MNGNQYDEIDLKKYFLRLIRHWRVIVLCVAISFVIGCVVALCIPRKYTVTTVLGPELSSSTTNRLSSLASLVGLSSALLGTTDAVYPMVYPDILRSPKFLVDLFDLPLTYEVKDETFETTLYEYVTSKKSIVGAIYGIFSPKRHKEDEALEVNSFHLTSKQWRVVRFLSRRITSQTDKKTMSISISVTLDNAVVCATLASAVNEKLREYVTSYRTEKSMNDFRYYEKIYTDAQRDYYDALTEYSRYVDSHQGLSTRSGMIETERLKNETNLRYQLYNSMAQELQLAKAKVQQETPVFTELIPPTVPYRASNSRKKTALICTAIGFLLSCCYVLITNRTEGI